MRIDVQVTGGDIFRRASVAIRRGLYRGLQSWGEKTRREVARKATRGERNSIFCDVDGLVGGEQPNATIYTAGVVGVYREFGTGLFGPRRRRITALGGPYIDAKGRRRKRRMLRWVSDGEEIFAYSVAGMRPDPWFFPTIHRAARTTLGVSLSRAVRTELRAAVRGGGGRGRGPSALR